MAERSPPVETSKRSMFSGLRLKQSQDDLRQGRDETQPSPVEGRPRTKFGHLVGFERSVDRFARAWNAIDKMDRRGQPIFAAQKAELQRAGEELDRHSPNAARLLAAAVEHDPGARRAIEEMSERERVEKLVEGMRREEVAQRNRTILADRQSTARTSERQIEHGRDDGYER